VGIFVVPPRAAVSARVNAFSMRLRELGYTENKDMVVESRFADGKLDLLTPLADELVRLKVDVIVSGGPATTRASKKATSTIPIIMAQDDDPVGNGFVASLARPGGNITGLSTLAPEMAGKHWNCLKRSFPSFRGWPFLVPPQAPAMHKP
jgi:putative ABC transport system substrate-binding protein